MEDLQAASFTKFTPCVARHDFEGAFAVLRAHLARKDVQIMGFAVIEKHLSDIPIDRRRGSAAAVMQAGGLEAALTALEAHSEHARVASSACALLSHLAIFYPLELGTRGAIEAAVGERQRHARDHCDVARADIARPRRPGRIGAGTRLLQSQPGSGATPPGLEDGEIGGGGLERTS